MTKTISLKPTYEEAARVSAYILASHSGTRPEDFLGGSYWEASELGSQRAIATWNAVSEVIEALEKVGLDFYKQSKTFKARLIKSAWLTVCKELTSAEARPDGWV
jgi:hypothetical protein